MLTLKSMMLNENYRPLKRILVGAVAGFAAALVKYWAHDHADFVAVMIRPEDRVQIPWILVGYAIGATVLLILGALAAWISAENSLAKLFVIGLSAPSLFSSGIPKAPKPIIDPKPVIEKRAIIEVPRSATISGIFFIAAAHAQTRDEPCISSHPIQKGFYIFFGVQEKYRVVVGSFSSRAQAVARAKAINDEDPTLKATVGLRHCDSSFYPVVVGEPLAIEEARRLLERARKIKSVEPDSFLSPTI